MFLNRLLLLLYIRVEGPIYEEELFQKKYMVPFANIRAPFFLSRPS
jgi:hypothetical protein